MVIKMKQFMIDMMKVKMLRDSIERVEEKRDTFLLGI